MECISRNEAFELAKHEHETNGHWGRDLIKLKLLDSIWSLGLDQTIIKVLQQCGHCKNFGPMHLHALLHPITCRHPFELLVADYLSLPKGKGGFHTVLLVMDVFSHYVWGYKLKHHGTGKATVDALQSIAHTFQAPETLMTDGGSHFNNGEVKGWCVANSMEHRVTAAYAPWVNGLMENANGLLLGRLRRLCNGEAGGEDNSGPLPPDVDRNWPDHFDTAVRQLNECIIPSLHFSPKELLLGYVINTVRTPATTLDKEPGPADSDVHLVYADQQPLDATDHATLPATQRKAVFDQSVLSSSMGEVIFTHDQLVQVHESARETTLSTSCKLRPQWSVPRRVKERVGNSYKLTTLEGFPMPGLFHACRLQLFILRAGSPLANCKSVHTEGQHTTEDSTNEVLVFGQACAQLPM